MFAYLGPRAISLANLGGTAQYLEARLAAVRDLASGKGMSNLYKEPIFQSFVWLQPDL